ncbi:hypothetical protein ACFQ9X_00920 [Catenulispora yoronensis]
MLPAHSASLERPIRHQDLEHLGRQLGHQRAEAETEVDWIRRFSTDIGSFQAAHRRTPLSGSALERHLAARDGRPLPPSHPAPIDLPRRTAAPPPQPRRSVTAAEARALSLELGGRVTAGDLRILAAVNLAKFPELGRDPVREPKVSDFADLVHQLLGPDQDVGTGIERLAAAVPHLREGNSLSALDAALTRSLSQGRNRRDPNGFFRAPWVRARYELSPPWADRHSIERDAALLYHRVSGKHAPENPDAATMAEMRRALEVAKLAHTSYDRRGHDDPESFYRALGARLPDLPNETGAPSDLLGRLLHAAADKDIRYRNPDFLARPIRDRLHNRAVPRPPIGHAVPPADLVHARSLAAALPGLFTAAGFDGHERVEARLRAMIPAAGRCGSRSGWRPSCARGSVRWSAAG